MVITLIIIMIITDIHILLIQVQIMNITGKVIMGRHTILDIIHTLTRDISAMDKPIE